MVGWLVVISSNQIPWLLHWFLAFDHKYFSLSLYCRRSVHLLIVFSHLTFFIGILHSIYCSLIASQHYFLFVELIVNVLLMWLHLNEIGICNDDQRPNASWLLAKSILKSNIYSLKYCYFLWVYLVNAPPFKTYISHQ